MEDDNASSRLMSTSPAPSARVSDEPATYPHVLVRAPSPGVEVDYVPVWTPGRPHTRLPGARSQERERWFLTPTVALSLGVPVDLARVAELEAAWAREAVRRAAEEKEAAESRRVDEERTRAEARVREAKLAVRRDRDRVRRETAKVAREAEAADRLANVCLHCGARLDPAAERVLVGVGILHPACVGRAWCARCKREVVADEGMPTQIGKIHVECELMAPQRAAEMLRVGVSQFRRLVEALGIGPDEERTNPHYKSGPPMTLYLQPTIAALEDHPAVIEARRRTGGPAPKDYAATFDERYGSPESALADACEAIFNLNRYTRHPTCSDAHREEILDLKTRLIEHIYSLERYTDRVTEVTKTLPPKECFRCDGTGMGDYGECDRCSGTGVFQETRDVTSYVFAFTVGGARYTWMQPDRVMSFVPRVEETRSDEGAKQELDTTLNIPRSKLAEAKALVRYALRAGAKMNRADSALEQAAGS